MEAKKHLEIADGDTAHDDHVSQLIVAVRELFEHDTQSITVERTVNERMPMFPCPNWRFYFRPVQSVTSISYIDESDTKQQLPATDYSVDYPNRQIHFEADILPTTAGKWDAVDIEYVAGFPQASVPEIAKSAMKLQLDILFELRGEIMNRDKHLQAYQQLIERYLRSSYP